MRFRFHARILMLAVGVAGLPLSSPAQERDQSRYDLELLAPVPPFVVSPSWRPDLLSQAVRAGADAALIRVLVAAGADVAFRSVDGTTPLHLVQDPAVAATLVELGADPCALDVGGRPALAPETVVRARSGGPASVAETLSRALLSCVGR